MEKSINAKRLRNGRDDRNSRQGLLNCNYKYVQGFKGKHEHNGERIGRYKKEPKEIFRAENTIVVSKNRISLSGLYRKLIITEEEISELIGTAV